jgi:hypothetical protein
MLVRRAGPLGGLENFHKFGKNFPECRQRPATCRSHKGFIAGIYETEHLQASATALAHGGLSPVPIILGMNKQEANSTDRTLLVFNCHEPWVYQLDALDYRLDIIVGLRGKYNKGWDYQMRPLPARARLISLREALGSPTEYYCIIAHNTTDLLDVRSRPEPRLMVVHHTLEGRIQEEHSSIDPDKMKEMLHTYVELIGADVVATSMFKGESWGFTDDIVQFGVDAEDYPPYSGHEAAGLRICNFISSRRQILLWDFHERAFEGLPVTLVGHNPDMPGVEAARDWNHLKQILQAHRFYIHTADPRFEAGYNMATAEAMGAGLPVIGNRHPTSPIKHGVSGFLSDNPKELRRFAQILLEDQGLARMMGQQARKTVIERFSLARFKHAFLRSIEIARRKWHTRKVDPSSSTIYDLPFTNCCR